MPIIKFSAFSFLRTQLNDRDIACAASPLEIPDNISVDGLIAYLQMNPEEVEAVFVNHRIMPKSTILKEGDRIALVPPGGIPGHVAAYVGKNHTQ